MRTPHVYDGRPDQAFFHCAACDVNYLFPGLSPKEEHDFYVREFESFMGGRSGKTGGWHAPQEHIDANEAQRQRRMAYLEPLLPSSGTVLEVGCSSGFMLLPLAERGLECVGIEPSGIFSDFVRQRGLTCYENWEAFKRGPDGERQFDLIMHFFVLEHVSDPVSFLAEQYENLAPGGRLVVEIPNAADPLATILDIPAFERFYWSVAHHWYFNEQSLEYVLKKTSPTFDIRLDQRYDLSNHMVWARDGRPGGAGRFSQQWGEEVERAYKDALVRSRHCDTLIGVLHKEEQ